MERKIGEIFEYNGEWYQCVEGKTICSECDLRNIICQRDTNINNPFKGCSGNYRTDKMTVIFKKLEKVGEPYEYFMQGTGIILVQEYILASQSYICGEEVIDCQKDGRVAIEIKQNKEDNPLTRIVYAYVNGKISDNELIKSIKEMSDEYPYNKNNIKPFSLEAAKAGKPVCTRDGCKARIICWDIKDKDNPIAAAVFVGECESVYLYTNKGEYNKGEEDELDLMMLPEKKEGWVNVYKHNLYDTESEAKRAHVKEGYIDTIKIEWEE